MAIFSCLNSRKFWASLFLSFIFLPTFCFAQSANDLSSLDLPDQLDLSPDGARLWYKFHETWWEVDTAPNSQPKLVENHQVAPKPSPPKIEGTARLSSPQISPDGKRVACLDAEQPYGPLLLFCRPSGESQQRSPLSHMPIFSFRWAPDSKSLWVIGMNGADEPVGRLTLDGRFDHVTQDVAMRRKAGLEVSSGVVAWVQSDASHYGTIWIIDTTGKPRLLVDPNPQTREWSQAWMQRVVRWKNKHGEELQGVLVTPAHGDHFPLIVDPYSSWRNRFLNIPVLGNYIFVNAGFAVFFPDHRAPHTFPEMAFGRAYVGMSKDRDPIDVVTDDVMSGVAELIQKGVADHERLFLYSFSNGASAIDQLLTQTHEFRAAVSGAGVSNWLGYYQLRHPAGDETIPGFLGGKTPEQYPDLYRRISPVYQVDKIVTPLLLIIGKKDTRYSDTIEFYNKLRAAGRPVSLVVYPDDDHGISDSEAEPYILKAIEFFRAADTSDTKTYFCDGMWQTNTQARSVLNSKSGGNDSEFLNMIELLRNTKYSELINECEANIKSVPEWLTPRLFCGLAYAHLNDKGKALVMLKEFESRAGPSYDTPPCHDMTVILRSLVK
jgi:dipeptidyl aminopeptidase/acylaminoacyl peptidase